MEIEGILTGMINCKEPITERPLHYLTVAVPCFQDDYHQVGYTSFDIPIISGEILADLRLGDKVKITIEPIR
jgi:hypothetical protein